MRIHPPASFKLAMFASLALVYLAASLPVRAQNPVSGTLIGTVRDRNTGALITKASVKVVNDQTNHPRATVTNAQGEYRVPFLAEGSYTISATKADYKPETLPKFLVQFGQYNPVGSKYFRLDILLRRAAFSDAVNDAFGRAFGPSLSEAAAYVSSKLDSEGAPTAASQAAATQTPNRLQASEGEQVSALIRLVDAARGGHFGGRQLEALPLGGASYTRSFDELAWLLPGVAPPPYTPGARGPGVGFGIGTAGQFAVNGLRARSNNFSVDGSDNNDADVGVRRQGFVALVPQPIESVHGVSVVTALWDAELGRNMGAQVNAVSRYGGNQFHGEAYGFFNDSRLNARNFFDYTGGVAGGQDPFTRAQVGGVLGGPIVKDRTHFFASFERDRINASTEQHFATPTAAERRFCVAGAPCLAQGSTFGAFAFNNVQVFPGRTPLGNNVLSFYPLPNYAGGPYGANTFTQILPADGDGLITSFRLTEQFTERQQLNARYNFTDDERLLPSVNRAINSTQLAQTRSHNLSLILDSALDDKRFNQARVSFGRTRLNFRTHQGSPLIFQRRSDETIRLGANTFPFESQTGPIGELLIEPFSPVGVGGFYFPQDRASNTLQYADTFTWLFDKHQFKLGGNLRRFHLNSRLDRLYRPQVVYGGGLASVGNVTVGPGGSLSFTPDAPTAVQLLSGVELASLGVASAVLQTITGGTPDSTIALRFNEYHLFVNDNWRIKPHLTLDYGLRYEYNSVPHSVDKRIERALTLETLPALGDSRFNAAARTNKFNGAVNAYRRVLDGRNRIYDPDKNNFGPHVGLAWDPLANRDGQAGRTAVRAGYGIYYDTILGAVVTQSRNVFPREIPVNVDPSFLGFDAYSLNNPALLRLVQDAQGNFTNPLDLLRAGACNQFGACNQLGGAPGDVVALLGQLFNQNQLGGGLAFTLTDKRLRTPYAQHWHLTVEREFFGDYSFSAAYVGTKGTKLTRLVTPNLGSLVTPYLAVARTFNNVPNVIFNSFQGSSLIGGALANRPDANLGAYQIYENAASSNYHALQLAAGKRYNHGLQFTAAYTWSHALDDVSDIFTLAGAPIVPQCVRGGSSRSCNATDERGSASYDLRHRLATSLLWDWPLFENAGGWRRALLGGWQTAAIFQAHTGQPFTLTLPFDNDFDGNFADRPATTAGLIFTSGHARQRVALAPNRSFRDYTNFTINNLVVTPGVGLVGRNTVRGAGFINLDLALHKQFSFADQQRLTLRADFFNLLNRANFGLPLRTIGAPSFGAAVETVNPARTIQLALRYSF